MRMLAALTLSALSINFASAEVTPVFNGAFEIYSQNGCVGENPVGSSGTIRFQQLDGGTALVFVQNAQVRSYFLPSDTFDNTYKPVQTMYMRYDFGAVNHSVAVKFVRMSPATISATTPEIRIVGEVRGFTTATCIAKFTAIAVRWLQF